MAANIFGQLAQSNDPEAFLRLLLKERAGAQLPTPAQQQFATRIFERPEDQIPTDSPEINLPPEVAARVREQAVRHAGGKGTFGRMLLWRLAPELAARRTLVESSTINGPEYQDWRAAMEGKLAENSRVRAVGQTLQDELGRQQGYELGLIGQSENATLDPDSVSALERGRRLAGMTFTDQQLSQLPLRQALFLREGSKAVGEAGAFALPATRETAFLNAAGYPEVTNAQTNKEMIGINRDRINMDKYIADQEYQGRVLTAGAQKYVADMGLLEKQTSSPDETMKSFADFYGKMPQGTDFGAAVSAFSTAMSGGDPAAFQNLTTAINRAVSSGRLADLLKSKDGYKTLTDIETAGSKRPGFFGGSGPSQLEADLARVLREMASGAAGNAGRETLLDRLLQKPDFGWGVPGVAEPAGIGMPLPSEMGGMYEDETDTELDPNMPHGTPLAPSSAAPSASVGPRNLSRSELYRALRK